MKNRLVSTTRWFPALFFCIALITGSCVRKSPVEGKLHQNLRLTMSLPVAVETLDWTKAKDEGSALIAQLIQSGLTQQNGQDELTGALAKEWRQENGGLHYRFTLKSSSWNDGLPVTAEQFVHSWTKTGFEKENIQKLRAPDEKTLEVALLHPDPLFLKKVASPSSFPVRTELKIDPNDPLMLRNTGRFRVREWKKENNRILLEPNPYFYGGMGTVAELEIFYQQDDQQNEADLTLLKSDLPNRTTWATGPGVRSVLWNSFGVPDFESIEVTAK